MDDRVLLSAALPFQPQATIASVAVPGMIEGTVAATTPGAANVNIVGIPIQLIQLVGLTTRVVAVGQTDGLGRFDFTDLKSGDYVVREAKQAPLKPDTVFLDGVPVDVGDVDLVTGGPYPATHLGYKSNGTVLTAVAPGPTVFPPRPSLAARLVESPAAGLFEARADQIRRFLGPSHINLNSNRQAIIDGSYLGLRTVIGLLS